jgi:hypothetical protein
VWSAKFGVGESCRLKGAGMHGWSGSPKGVLAYLVLAVSCAIGADGGGPGRRRIREAREACSALGFGGQKATGSASGEWAGLTEGWDASSIPRLDGPPSSRGLGHRLFKPRTGVRIPLGGVSHSFAPSRAFPVADGVLWLISRWIRVIWHARNRALGRTVKHCPECCFRQSVRQFARQSKQRFGPSRLLFHSPTQRPERSSAAETRPRPAIRAS